MGSSEKGFLTGDMIQTVITDNKGLKRDISLDLTVDYVIKNGKKKRRDVVRVKPQEMFVVVCKEPLNMPNNSFGIVYPKTTLCRKGIQVFNTGIIDPGYNGFVSTLAINFSKKSLYIKKNEVFLRLMVYNNEHDYAADIKKVSINGEEYINNRIKETEEYPKTFLDTERQIKKISIKLATRIMRHGTTILFGIIAFITFLCFWYQNSKVDELKAYYTDKVSELLSVEASCEQIEDLNRRYNKLDNKLKEAEKIIEAYSNIETNKVSD